MKINPEIKEKLEGAFSNSPTIDSDVDAGIQYLLCIYFNLHHDFTIPYGVIRVVNILKICERDFEKNSVKWNIPLFLEESPAPEEDAWLWVLSEYRELFSVCTKSEAKGDSKACLKKMKTFFAENPDIRKEEVIEATKMYIVETGANSPYIQRADYFISKADPDKTKSSRLRIYVEKLRASKEEGKDRTIGQWK